MEWEYNASVNINVKLPVSETSKKIIEKRISQEEVDENLAIFNKKLIEELNKMFDGQVSIDLKESEIVVKENK